MSGELASRTRPLHLAASGDLEGEEDADQVIIGKDLLELVSSAMYVDPMTIYREYIQNAADAIDEAKALGILEAERGQVEIEIDPATRTVRIRDNGVGMAHSEVFRKLTAIGGSAKRGTKARGFRGVGRLAGLGYAQELIFRSRVHGESKVSEMRWDCRKLKAQLRDATSDSGVGHLINQVVAITQEQASGFPERFFEVELRGLVRLHDDRLLSAAAIADYLSQVAPVPFSPDFRFGDEISAALRATVGLGELEITVAGTGPLYRPHRDALAAGTSRITNFDEVSFVEVPGMDGDTAAVAWFLHHEYEGALPTATLVKGVRLRSGNIQIGENALLEGLFPEPRFNSWAVGEIHIVDPKVMPNGRRDNFEQNAHLSNLLNHLGPATKDIAHRCRTSSVKRKLQRDFEIYDEQVNERLGILQQGLLGETPRNAMALGVDQALMRMEKIAAANKFDDVRDLKMLPYVETLRTNLQSVMAEAAEASPLDRLPEAERSMYERMFELIYECAVNRSAAKALIDRILLKIQT